MHTKKEKMLMLGRLRKRSDFLCAQSKGQKWVSKGFVLQVVSNQSDELRFGLTVSKKLSPRAVIRNRARRRLRALAYDVLPDFSQQGLDYVFIGRHDLLDKPYSDLVRDLKWCLRKLGCSTERKQSDKNDN